MGTAHQGEIPFPLIFLLSICSQGNYNGKVITLKKVAQGFSTPTKHTSLSFAVKIYKSLTAILLKELVLILLPL